MFFVEDVMIAKNLKTARFGCRLEICQGVCCEEGEKGAPLTEEEASLMKKLLPEVRSMLEPEQQAIVDQTAVVLDEEGWHTPLMWEEGPCAYLVRRQGKPSLCAFEILNQQKNTGFPKPVSCHLFPLLQGKSLLFRTLRMQFRESCQSACRPDAPHVVEFCREALIRAYGEEFVRKLYVAVGLKEPA